MNNSQHTPPRGVKRRLFLITWLAAVFGAIAIIPYSLATQADLLQELPLPLPVVIGLSILQSSLILAIITFAGLWLSGRVGLGLPYITGWLQNKTISPQWGTDARLGVGLGVLATALMAGLEFLLFLPAMQRANTTFPETDLLSPLHGFLASFYGGITEEVLLRLFLMSLFVWLLSLASGWRYTAVEPKTEPANWVFWTAIIIATILFGVGHLPATAAMGVPLTGLIVTRALVLNGIAGLFFGWLYWKRGLESAIIAHFTADIMLHVVLPLIL